MSYSDVYAQAHGWIVGVTGYSTAEVIPSDDTGPRPALPYITIGVLTYDTPIYLTDDVVLNFQDGALQESQRGARRATLSIQGYGKASAPALEALARTLQLSSTAALLTTMDVESISAVSRVPVPMTSDLEVRYGVSVTVVYSDATDAAEVPHAETIEVTQTYDGTPSDITQTITVPIP